MSRENVIAVRVSDAELDDLQARARAAGLNLSAYVRMVLRQTPRLKPVWQGRRPPPTAR